MAFLGWIVVAAIAAAPEMVVLPAMDATGQVVDAPSAQALHQAAVDAGGDVADLSRTSAASELLERLRGKKQRCAAGQFNCFANVGILLGAAQIIVTTISLDGPTGANNTATILLIDTERTELLRQKTIVLPVGDDARVQSVRAAIHFVVTGNAVPTPSPLIAVKPAPPVAVTVTNGESSTSPMTVIGGVTAGAGLMSAGALLALALSSSATYQDASQTVDARQSAYELGPAFLVGAAAFGGVAILGTGLFIVGVSNPSDSSTPTASGERE